MRVGITALVESSVFSSGATAAAFQLAILFKGLGHDTSFLSISAAAHDWWDDVHGLKGLWPVAHAAASPPPYDLIIDLHPGRLNDPASLIVPGTGRYVWFIREPAIFKDMEGCIYPIPLPKRIPSSLSAVWTWDLATPADIQYLELLTRRPVSIIPFYWSSLVVDAHLKAVGLNSWSQTAQQQPWHVHVAETNQKIASSCVLPMTILKAVEDTAALELSSIHIHNSQHLENNEYFKGNTAKHTAGKTPRSFEARQRCIDWIMHPRSMILSHIRFLPLRYSHLEALWAGIPLVHNAEGLRRFGGALARFSYEGNSITGAVDAVRRVGSAAPTEFQEWHSAVKEQIRDHFKIERIEVLLAIQEALSRLAAVAPAPAAAAATQAKPLTIAFDGMWDDFNPEHNFLTLLLEAAGFKVVGVQASAATASPDLYVFGPLAPNGRLTFPAAVPKIFLTGENVPPQDHPDIFLNIGFQDPSDQGGLPNCIRFPLWAMYIDWFGADPKKYRNPGLVQLQDTLKVHEGTAKRDKFAAFVVSNPMNEERGRAFDTLSAYKHVDSAGRYKKNISVDLGGGRGGGGGEAAKIAFYRDYRFALTYENSKRAGYITEKLFHAKVAGCVPIYCGAPDVARDFDPAGFVHVGCEEELVAAVRRLEEDPAAFEAAAAIPALTVAKAEELRRIMARITRTIVGKLLGDDAAGRVPEVLGVAPLPQPQQQPLPQSQPQRIKQDYIIYATYLSANFTQFLPYWYNSAAACLRPDDKIRIYIAADVDEAQAQAAAPQAEIRRVPTEAPPAFPDFWAQAHYGWKLWVWRDLATEGSLVVYSDCGSIILHRPLEALIHADTVGACVYNDREQFNYQWCQPTFSQALNVSPEELQATQAFAGAFIFDGSNETTHRLLEDCWNWAQRREVLAGPKWAGVRPDGKRFGHRHDQSILSILSARAGLPRRTLQDDYTHISLEAARSEGKAFYFHRGVLPQAEREALSPKAVKQPLPAIVINLDRRKDRLESFRAAHSDLEFERLSAYDGCALRLTPEIHRLFRPNDFFWKKAVLGCAMSHLAVWQKVAEATKPYLILEDDARLAPGWQKALQDALQAVPVDYDVLYLGGILPPNRAGFDQVKEQVAPGVCRVAQNKMFGQPEPTRYFHFCNYSYVLTPAAARKILNRIIQRDGFYTSADHMICNQVDLLNLYFVDPLPAGCSQDTDPAYTASQFNNFSRVDTFDSDLWTNDERWSAEERSAFKEYVPLDIGAALREEGEAWFSFDPNTAAMLEYKWLHSILNVPSQAEPLEAALKDPSPDATFIVARPHIDRAVQILTKYNELGHKFRVIHLSDEYCSDSIAWYGLSNCTVVYRNYARAGLPGNAKVIPLGYWRVSAAGDISSADRPLLWSFHGCSWAGRVRDISYLVSQMSGAGDERYSVKLLDEWRSSQMTPEAEYRDILRSSKFVLCPRGNNPETFRLYEALEAGAVPLYVRSDGDEEFWNWIRAKIPLMNIKDYEAAAKMLKILGQAQRQEQMYDRYRRGVLDAWDAWKKELA